MAAKLLTEVDPATCQHRFTHWQYVPQKDLQPRAFETVSCRDTTVTRPKGVPKKHEIAIWKRTCRICGHEEYRQGCRQLDDDEA